jgi:hypothetical protein
MNAILKITKKFFIYGLLCLVIILSAHSCKENDSATEPNIKTEPDKPSPVEPPGKGILHFKGKTLTSLDVISSATLSEEQKVIVSTLQGLVSKTSAEQIYIDEGGAGTVWKNHLMSAYGITLTNYTSWTDLLSHFNAKIKGYVLYDRKSNPRSLTAATSLCPLFNAIAVDVSMEDAVRAAGVTSMKADVRTRDEKWVYQNYATYFTRDMAAELKPTISHHLRDYISLSNAFTFYDGITPWRSTVLQGLSAEAFCFGYYAEDEFNMVANAAEQGVVMIPTDLAPNLSALSSIYNLEGLTQSTYTTPTTEAVHYVTFLASDGDNIAFNLWSQHDYFTNVNRGTFNMGYTISPSLVDLAPSVLRWYYEHASKGTFRDFFVAGPSGSGYTFPSRFSADGLDAYLGRLNTFMGAADLNIVNILDQGAYHRTDIWNKFLAQPNIDALLYTGYGESPQGRITFADNGKPIVEARDNLWAGLEEEETVINDINARPADPTSVEGYSLVFVHVWTKNLSHIKAVVEGLNANVKVVTPDAFVKLIKANVKTGSDNGSVPEITDGATYKLLNYNSGLSLDVEALSQSDGAKVEQWTYNNGTNQQWIFAAQGDGYYKISAAHSGKVLQVIGAATAAGTNLEQSTWTGADHQLWRAASNGDGTYTLTNKKSNLVAAIEGASPSNGAMAEQQVGNNTSNQKWIVQLP